MTGVIPQENYLDSDLTVHENLDAVARQSDSAGDWAPMFRALDEVRAAVADVLARFAPNGVVVENGVFFDTGSAAAVTLFYG